MNSPILAPAAVLVAWTLVMMFWMIAARTSGVKKAGIDLLKQRGGRGQQLDGVLPGPANWPAHNYSHLVEQPTIFYAIVVILALAGAGSGLALALAWAYVGLRVLHSIWQATVNSIPIRLLLFALSSFALIGLTIIALAATLNG